MAREIGSPFFVRGPNVRLGRLSRLGKLTSLVRLGVLGKLRPSAGWCVRIVKLGKLSSLHSLVNISSLSVLGKLVWWLGQPIISSLTIYSQLSFY